jgi:hypothetical protein
MAIENAIFCNDGVTFGSIDFSAQTIPIGTIVTGTDGTAPPDNINYCFEITDIDEPLGTITATTETYSSCYDCLVNNFTVVNLVACDDETITPAFPISAFGYIPIIDQVIYAEIEYNKGGFTSYTKCFKVIEVIQVSENDYVTNYEPNFSNLNQIIFNNFSIENGCNECLYGFSSGTESTICEICCPCTTGETVNSVSVPHPNYSNGQNQTIIQLNAITIGGFNGLNN